MLSNETGRQERKGEVLAIGKACKVVLWLTPNLKETNLHSSEFSAKATLISAPAGIPVWS